jgi:hypothetical protein
MSDPDPTPFNRSLAETIAWCAAKLGDAQPDAAAIRHRAVLNEQARQHLREAREYINRPWYRRGIGKTRISATKQWRQAMDLLAQLSNSLGPMKDKLRSTVLNPNFNLDDFRINAPWADAVAQVIATRSQLVGKISIEERALEANGRLLLYWPHENLACGGAEVSSNGFFDVNNVPPWDIWVDYSDRTLVSWVPPLFIEAAQLGIDANPEECIQWAKR